MCNDDLGSHKALTATFYGTISFSIMPLMSAKKGVLMIQNILQPTREQVRGLRDRQTGDPITMLNLLKFRDVAEYEEGGPNDLSGRDAYKLYGEGFRRVMEPKGARVIYSGEARGFLIGEGEGEWDAIALIEYPSAQVMLDMFRDPDYQAVQKHRAAGLVGQLLIECGEGFSI
jgi:uncharacterized protein (DUF1330 family)